MKRKNKYIKILILFLILFTISASCIILKGNTYTKSFNIKGINDIEELNIIVEDENIIKCIDKRIENGEIKVTVKSQNKGETYLTINTIEGDYCPYEHFYVHEFGIITSNEFLGDCNGSIIIPISTSVFLIYTLYLSITAYKQNVKTNMYQYKNILYLGLSVFLSFAIFSQLNTIFNYRGLISTIDDLLGMCSFTILLLPITFVVSILVVISNISLVRKEGFNVRNILGIFLGVFLCALTILPDRLYNLLYSASWIDVHNENGIGLYIYNFCETTIYIVNAYITCILIGTIIMGLKSAKHIPAFDKDFIIILGCQIKKDGSLTNLLKGRVDRAIEFGKMQKENIGKEIVFVPSGGKGDDEVLPEAQAMKNYLIEQGIKEEKILVEDKSKNTYENIKFSNSLIDEKMKKAKVAFSTTNYHVFRAGHIASLQGLEFEGIGAKTKSYFWINAFIREFIATLFSEKKKHILIIGSIVLFSIAMIAVTYINANM